MEQATAHGTPASGRSRNRAFRFEGFEVIPDLGELRKNGVRLRLGGQPFRILVLLLENPGQVVTREELRRQLWADHTHVDFDHCLNTAINKLRETLGDSAEKPRFIQTIPRLGYRFLVPVELVGGPSPAPDVRAVGVPDPSQRQSPFWLIGGLMALVAGLLALSLWRSPVGTGALTELALTNLPGTETTPSFSPDGTEVVFSWGGESGDNFDIYVQPVGRGKLRRLTDNPADEFGPAYSPDGRSIAFYRRSGDYAAVYSVSPLGGRLERLFGLAFGPPGRKFSEDRTWIPEKISWSPDGKLMAVVDRDTPDGPLRIFLSDLETRRFRALTFPPAGSEGDRSPSFSPDGQSVAFVRWTAPHTSDVFVVALVGGGPKRLTTAAGRIMGLAWTADGRRIVFSSDRSGEAVLLTVPVSGGHAEPVTGVGEGAVFPSVSPTAARLVYARLAGVGYLMRRAIAGLGGPPTAAGRLLPFPASTPQISPDGGRIAFSSGKASDSQIWVSGTDGTQIRRLTAMPLSAGSPRWSPDGTWIAFDSLERGGWDVFVIRPDGTGLRKMTWHEGSDLRPSWSSDGNWLYFGSDRSGTMEIWKMPFAGGRAVQITFQGGYDAVESPDGKRIFYTRRGVPGLWTRPVDGGAHEEEKLLIKELEWQNSRNWTVRKDGIYFLACGAGGRRDRPCFLRRYRFDTGALESVLNLGELRLNDSGCSISPDGAWLYYVQRAETETDIAMVEGWR